MIFPLSLLVLGGLGVMLASALMLRAYTRFAARARGAVVTALPRGTRPSPLDTLFDPLEAAHPGQHGLANLLDPLDAFAVRSLSAGLAGRSLDLMYYIWSNDLTGRLLMADLLAAADRGVRVRLLLDDVNVQGFDLAFLALGQHPLIEVRLFNPIRTRGHWVQRILETGLGLSRFNRRIHGKAWIVDGRLAIIGGRNINDTGFDALPPGAFNSRDCDVILAGPKLADVEAVFDGYWNMGLSLPILTLWPRFRIPATRFRKRLARHNAEPAAQDYRQQAVSGKVPQSLLIQGLRWTDKVELLADPPGKAYGQHSTPWLADRVTELQQGALQEVRLITPYFVPGSQGAAALAKLRARGVAFRLLTNSLAATDFLAVFGAYSTYRGPLVRAGALVFEYAPAPNAAGQRDLLHSKLMLIDGRLAVVGSHNFDMRSIHTNIELGLSFEEPVLVAELMQAFDILSSPDQAYAVAARRGGFIWTKQRAGQPVTLQTEPEAHFGKRLVAWAMGKLPFHHFM